MNLDSALNTSYTGNEDLSLPKATVQKIITEILAHDSGVSFARETRDLMIECCVEFITMISSQANEIAEKDAKKTIACEHVTSALRELGWIIGQHHAHMIPRGLPGEGNILVFDNGGWAGYGAPNPGAPTGFMNAQRDYSRVLEFDPTTLKIVWQYTPIEAGFIKPVDANRFYSPFISSAQRLPNGNTLITEGSGGRIFEVTADCEICLLYTSPSPRDRG